MLITENTFFYSTQLTNEAYHADPAIGSSGLKKFSECPAIYQDAYIAEDRAPFKETGALRIGSFAHVRLLEPDRFLNEYAIAPEMAVVNKGKKNEETKPMTRVHGDWKAFEEKALNEGRSALLFSEFRQAEAMALKIANDPLASRMLVGGHEEMSFFAKDPETGLMLKARPDYLVKLNDFGTVLVDYKTTGVSLGNKKQSDLAFNLGRHIQASHHKRVTELATNSTINEVVYITQMQERPYLVRVFRMLPEGIAIGDDMCREYLRGIADCQATDNWPGYPAEIEDYTLPRWMEYEYN